MTTSNANYHPENVSENKIFVDNNSDNSILSSTVENAVKNGRKIWNGRNKFPKTSRKKTGQKATNSVDTR